MVRFPSNLLEDCYILWNIRRLEGEGGGGRREGGGRKGVNIYNMYTSEDRIY